MTPLLRHWNLIQRGTSEAVGKSRALSLSGSDIQWLQLRSQLNVTGKRLSNIDLCHDDRYHLDILATEQLLLLGQQVLLVG